MSRCGGGGGMYTSLAVVSTLLRGRCLLMWFVCVCRCRGFSPYHLYGVGDL